MALLRSTVTAVPFGKKKERPGRSQRLYPETGLEAIQQGGFDCAAKDRTCIDRSAALGAGQALCTWLPTFNNEILKLPTAMSVQGASIFAACLAIGRLSAGVVMRKVHWYTVMNGCVLGMAAMVLVALPLTRDLVMDSNVGWSNAPLAIFVFPLIGLFMAPIYPGINSVMLSSLPKNQHSSMTGLLVIFSALGGTTGSFVTGYVFGNFSGHFAFYLTLVPIALVLVTLFFFRRQVEQVA